jgi:hypothetical protein
VSSQASVYRNSLSTIVLLGYLATAAIPFAKAADSVAEHDCYYRQSPNSPPVRSLKKCEIVSSMSQGSYYFEIRFNASRQYTAAGVWEGGHNGKVQASSKLNGKEAKQIDYQDYICWQVANPFHEVCISRF